MRAVQGFVFFCFVLTVIAFAVFGGIEVFKYGFSPQKPVVSAPDKKMFEQLREEAFADLPYLFYTPWVLKDRGLAVTINDRNVSHPDERFLAEMRKYRYPIDCINSISRAASDQAPVGTSSHETHHLRSKVDAWKSIRLEVVSMDYARSAGISQGDPGRAAVAEFWYAYKGPDVPERNLNDSKSWTQDMDPTNPRYQRENWKLVKVEIDRVSGSSGACQTRHNAKTPEKNKVYWTERYLLRHAYNVKDDAFWKGVWGDYFREFPVPWNDVRPEKNRIFANTKQGAPYTGYPVNGLKGGGFDSHVVAVESGGVLQMNDFGVRGSGYKVNIGNVHVRPGVVVNGKNAAEYVKSKVLGKKVELDCWWQTLDGEKSCSVVFTEKGKQYELGASLISQGYAWIDNTKGVHPKHRYSQDASVATAEKHHAARLPAAVQWKL